MELWWLIRKFANNNHYEKKMASTLDHRTIFSPAQQYILQVMASVQSEKEIEDIKNLIAQYFANKALDAIDKNIADGLYTQDTINSWANEHNRTPYL